MKRIFTLAAAMLLTVGMFAQAPQKMSYQTVIRDASNALVASAPVGIQISILQGSATGTAVYCTFSQHHHDAAMTAHIRMYSV